jgi:hypothetical protein
MAAAVLEVILWLWGIVFSALLITWAWPVIKWILKLGAPLLVVWAVWHGISRW